MGKKDFSEAEKQLVKKFKDVGFFLWKGKKFKIEIAGKPRPSDGKGEPKTDVFVRGKSNDGEIMELKISYKKTNADFIGNKITENTAEEIFGNLWETKIIKCIESLKDNFKDKKLIYRRGYGRTEPGSITLGWRFELTNKLNGKLSAKINLSKKEISKVYAGDNLPESKKNSLVNGKKYANSGVANYMLVMDVTKKTTISDVIENLCPIEKYIEKHNEVYAAFKAVNYRTLKKTGKASDKIESPSRQLAVYVEWKAKNGKLCHHLVFNKPLSKTAGEALNDLISSLKLLNIDSTCDIDANNVSDPKIIYS